MLSDDRQSPAEPGPPAGRANGFDLVRLAAALAVVLDHSYLLLGRGTPVIASWTDRRMDLGGLAVLTFFAVSGYLVAGSWLGEPRLAAFARKRVLRIWPARCVLLVLTTLVLGPAVSTLGAREFLSRAQTWAYLQNVTLTPLQLHLPGVFESNPYAAKVNVALWTLPIEVTCYCLLAVVGFAGLLRRPRILVAATAAMALVAEFGLPAGGRDLLLLVAGFFAGGCLYVTRAPLQGRLGVLAAVLAAGCLGTPLVEVSMFCWVYLVVFAGTRHFPRLRALTRRGDPSYGIYIYGVPIQQCLVLAGVAGPLWLLALSVPLVCAAGYASWHLVERRALAWGRGRRRPMRYPAIGAPAPARVSVGRASTA